MVAFLAGTVAIWAVTNTGIAMLMGTRGHASPGLIRAGEALLNFALSMTLASIMGLEGVALATLIAAVVANLGFLLPYVCRDTGVRLSSLMTPLLLAHLPAAGITRSPASPSPARSRRRSRSWCSPPWRCSSSTSACSGSRVCVTPSDRR